MATNVTLDCAGLTALMGELEHRGFEVIGPRVRDGAIVYDQVRSVADLPDGWTDDQRPGHYRLARRGDRALFGFGVGPNAWKHFLNPARQLLFRAHREGKGFHVETPDAASPRFAFLGVRACDLAAIGIQDRVFTSGDEVDPIYRKRRAQAFVVAVQCAQAGGTCFCASMGAGPRARDRFDLALTEFVTPERHEFFVEVGSAEGASVIEALPHAPATSEQAAESERVTERVAASMTRALATDGLARSLVADPEHPRWTEVAARCITCANCTLVCPTCFCHTVEDTTDLSGAHAERWKRWDSCFTMDFSYLHGGSVRASGASRYRQWLTHKLSTWNAQFGTAGCVGCGRCVTWCPVGIDIIEEAEAIRCSPRPPR